MFGSQQDRILGLKGNQTMMILLWIAAAVAAVCRAQTDCSQGACYPPASDLLLGRAHQLRASSTCGLTGSEVFCTPYQQRRMKCCPCDSRNPNGPLAHTVKDVLSTSGPERWWQSRKEVSPVTLEANLENLFQLDNLVLSFKGPRPSEFVVEKTTDHGRTWQPALYFATDCREAFPQVPTTTPLSLDETYCYTLPPTDNNPYQDHTIQFSPLRQYSYVSAPNSRKIEKLSGLTGLRLRMTELGDVPRLPGRALSRFFALKEMRMMGSCMCHGHASRCLPDTYSNALPDSVQVNPQCDCQHQTAGVNCERCADLYNDLPWRPAEEGNTHTCQRCQCNNHAQRCHFDQAVYEASGWRSGGVCDDCLHHTVGPKCDQCAPGYQPNPRSQMDRPDACIRCVCNPEGTENGGRCDDITGSCQCKANVEGPRCDRCKRGHYGLSASNPLGCSECSCSPDSSLSDVCDPVTGQCPCRAHFHGLSCQVCSKGYWQPALSGQCQPCNCDPTRSYGDTCDQVTGQCQCRPNFGGRTCSECPDNMYGDALLGCRPCLCDPEGTIPEGCDKQTGACLCRRGVTGLRCDSCARDHCLSFPTCEACPSCYFSLDAQRQNLSAALRNFSPAILPTPPGGPGGDLGPRIRALENSLKDIRDSVSLPVSTEQQVDERLAQLESLRDQMNKMKNDISPLTRTPGLDSELDRLQDLLDRLTVEYKVKQDAAGKTPLHNNTGAFSAIQDAYNDSTASAQRVNASEGTVEQSADIREEIENDKKVQPANSRDLDRLNQSMASGPDLAPVAREVCGSVLSEPCTPLRCDADQLCPPEGTPPCQQGQKCVGALPLAKKAESDANDVKDRLDKLTKKITDTAEKLQETQETTNQARQSAAKLSDRMKQARDELEDDLKDTRDVINGLKEFLSDPSSNLSHIQNVSEWILKAKLPLSPEELKRKLDEMNDLAANLPDSTAVLREAEPQLDTARNLLGKAQDARDTALGVKAYVDNMLADFGPLENSVSNLEDSLEDSLEAKDTLSNRLGKVKDQLPPAERALDDAAGLLRPMKPQLDKLKGLLPDASDRAQDAQDSADDAQNEADSVNKDLQDLEKQLNVLKNQAPPPGTGGDSSVGDRLEKLQRDVGVLANTTDSILKSLGDKAESLRTLQDEIVQKSSRLTGLDVALQERLDQLRKKAHDLSTCQG